MDSTLIISLKKISLIILFSYLLIKFHLIVNLNHLDNLLNVHHYHLHILSLFIKNLNLLFFLNELIIYLLRRNAQLNQPKYLMNYQKQFSLNYELLISIQKMGQMQPKKLQKLTKINMKPMRNRINDTLNVFKIELICHEKYQENK